MHVEPSHWLHEIFYFQKCLWPFSTGANNSLIGREKIALIADSNVFSPIINRGYLLGSLLDRTPAFLPRRWNGREKGGAQTDPSWGSPFGAPASRNVRAEGEVHWLTPPRSWTFFYGSAKLWWSRLSVCTFPFLGCMVFCFCSRSLLCPRIVEKRP